MLKTNACGKTKTFLIAAYHMGLHWPIQIEKEISEQDNVGQKGKMNWKL